MQILTDQNIDEEAAKEYIQTPYKGFELLPEVPENLTILEAAKTLLSRGAFFFFQVRLIKLQTVRSEEASLLIP